MDENYQLIKTVGDLSLVAANRKHFKEAIEDGHTPLDVDELKALSGLKIIIGEGNPLLLLKNYFPNRKLRGVRCLNK